MVGFSIICFEHPLKNKSHNRGPLACFVVWLYFEFESEEDGEERGLIVPEEDFPACGNALGADVRRNNAPSGSLGDRPQMDALNNII